MYEYEYVYEYDFRRYPVLVHVLVHAYLPAESACRHAKVPPAPSAPVLAKVVLRLSVPISRIECVQGFT